MSIGAGQARRRTDATRIGRRQLKATSTASRRSSIGHGGTTPRGKEERDDSEPHLARHDRRRHRARRPAARPGRDHRAGGAAARAGAARPQLLPGSARRSSSSGGRRGKQLQVLTDGTYFINRWFATVEMQPEDASSRSATSASWSSYYGGAGEDVTGDAFRYGEQVERGRARRLEARAAAGQVRAQPVRAARRARARP